MISQRFFRAFSASRNRAFEALDDKKKFRSDIFSPYVSAEISRFREQWNGGVLSTMRPLIFRSDRTDVLCRRNDAAMTKRVESSASTIKRLPNPSASEYPAAEDVNSNQVTIEDEPVFHRMLPSGNLFFSYRVFFRNLPALFPQSSPPTLNLISPELER